MLKKLVITIILTGIINLLIPIPALSQVWDFTDLDYGVGTADTLPGMSVKVNNNFAEAKDRIDTVSGVNVLDYNGGAYTSQSFLDLIAAIGVTPTKVIVPTGAYTIDLDVTIPETMTIKMEKGAVLTINAGKTFDMSDANFIPSGRTAHFAGSGTPVFPTGMDVLPEWAGAVGDGTTDDSAVFNKLLLTNTHIKLTKPTYAIASTLTTNGVSNIHITSEVGSTLLWSGAVSGTLLEAQSASSMANVVLQGIKLDGNGETLWLADLEGFRAQSRLENVQFYNTGAGWLKSVDCWYSKIDQVSFWALYNGLPSGMTVADWKTVHNSTGSGPIHITNAQVASMGTVTVGRHGVDTANVPATAATPYQTMYIQGSVIPIDTISFESTWSDLTTKTEDVTALIYIYSGQNINIENFYIEHCHFGYAVRVYNSTDNVTINSMRLMQSNLFNYLVRAEKATKIAIKALTAVYTQHKGASTAVQSLFYSSAASQVELENVIWYEGDNILDYGGKNYFEGDAYGYGVTSNATNINLKRPPMVFKNNSLVYGWVNSGTDDYVYVDGGGAFYNGFGESIPFGVYYIASPNADYIGQTLRPPNIASSWNLCIDENGLVFIELQSAPRLNTWQKLVLASFTTDGAGNISSYASVATTTDAFYTNSTNNKMSAGTTAPASGAWARGDIVWNTTPSASSTAGWICITAGSPGAWEEFGFIGDDVTVANDLTVTNDATVSNDLTVTNDAGIGGDTDTTGVYKQGGTQVVGAQQTGWFAPTGTSTRTTFNTATVTTAQLAERFKALYEDLAAHGLID